MTHPTDSAIPGIPVTFMPYYIARAEFLELVDQIEVAVKSASFVAAGPVALVAQDDAFSLISKINQLDHSLLSLHQQVNELSRATDTPDASERDTFLTFGLVHEYKGLALAAHALRGEVVRRLNGANATASAEASKPTEPPPIDRLQPASSYSNTRKDTP